MDGPCLFMGGKLCGVVCLGFFCASDMYECVCWTKKQVEKKSVQDEVGQ